MNYNLLSIFIAGFILVAVLCSEYIYRQYGYIETGRKILHITGGICFAIVLSWLPLYHILGLGIFMLLGMIIVRKCGGVTLLDPKVSRGYGELYLMIAFFMIIVSNMWYPEFTLPMIFIMTFSDGLAPFGQYIFPKKLYQKKTYGGSLVFLLITCAILVFFLGFSLEIIGIALIITLAELFSCKGLDNIILPAVTFLLLFLFHLF